MLKNYVVKALRPPERDETPLSIAEVAYAASAGLVLTPRAALIHRAQLRAERRRAFRGIPSKGNLP